MEYVELGFEAQTTGLSDDKTLRAAKAFDDRYEARSTATQRQLATLRFDPTSTSAGCGFDHGLRHVLRNRYTLREKYDPFKKIEGKQKKVQGRYHRVKKPWTLPESEWAGRKTKGNSLDFFETTKSMHRMLQVDWEVAREHHQLAWNICQTQLNAEELKQIEKDKAFEAPCVVAVHETLKRHALIICAPAAIERTRAARRAPPGIPRARPHALA